MRNARPVACRFTSLSAWILWMAFGALGLWCDVASAQGGRVAIDWNDCSVGGSRNVNFSCNTNAGSHVLVASFVPDSAWGVTGITAYVEIQAGSTTLSPWWD